MKKGLISVVLLIYLCYEKTKSFNFINCICRTQRGALEQREVHHRKKGQKEVHTERGTLTDRGAP